ncbi:hypothetical protein FA15DRAFT_667366 [Coprinopsis marcescibilis]|uniref:peptidylprolyl isomerase n=1 Tax=Coprinopsis marcescibilis TaxID=230819 RepID=A0A5C3L1A5_COPMA|nr:hypothetical protein FA15DRAFT_667366 [Coprinopsis marcescibilis]
MSELAVWSLTIPADGEVAVSPANDIRLTNISFGEELPDANGRSVIKLNYIPVTALDEDEEEEEEVPEATTVLTALTAGKIEQTTINLVIKEGNDYSFFNTGKNPVYVTGNYIEDFDQAPSDDEDDSDDEDGYDLREVSSDVEMDPTELEGLDDSDASRFEEVEDIPEPKNAKASKRPRDSDVAEADAQKPPKDKKNKKLKAENGTAVPAEESFDKKEKKKEKKDKAPVTRELPGGLKLHDAKVGTGPEAKKGSRVSVRYIGKLENGSIFDKNTKGKPFQFVIGKGNVIKGWDEGIAGMRAGGERVLTVPPAMAYGKKGVSGIPANATLKFEVKLLEVA